MTPGLEPFQIAVPQPALDDLAERTATLHDGADRHRRDDLLADRRQVDGARTGLTHTLGGNTATVVVSLFGRD